MIRFDTKKDYEIYNSKIEENAKLQQENKQLKNNWENLKEYIKSYIKLMNDNPDIIEQGQLDMLYEIKEAIEKLEKGSDCNDSN